MQIASKTRLLAFVMGAAALPVAATTIVVDSVSTDPDPGTACTIGAAFYAAEHRAAFGGCPAGDGVDAIVLPSAAVFEFSEGSPSDGVGMTALPAVTGTVVLIGNGATLQSLVPACLPATPTQVQFRWFNVFASGHLSLFDIELVGGCMVDQQTGGSIYVAGGTLDLDHTTIRDSLADGGGGAIEVTQGSTLNIRDARFVGNSAPYRFGGAIETFSGASIERSYFSGNAAAFTGGAILTQFGRLSVVNSVFDGNAPGGAIVAQGPTAISFSTFSANGKALVSEGDATITGTIFNSGRGGSSSRNCQINGPAPVIEGATYSDDPSCGGATVADRADIALGDSGDYGGSILTLPLLPSSLAIDSVPSCRGIDGHVDDDARGAPRPSIFGQPCDAGSYEFDGVDHSVPAPHFAAGNVLLSFDDRVSEYTRTGTRVRDAWYPYRSPSDIGMGGIDAESLDSFRVSLGELSPALGRYQVGEDRWSFETDSRLSSRSSGMSLTHKGDRWFLGDIAVQGASSHTVVAFEQGVIVGTITSEGDINDVSLGRDGKLYVLTTTGPSKVVRRYDPDSLTEIGSIDVDSGTTVAADMLGNVYVGNTAMAAIVRFDATGQILASTDCVVPGNTVVCSGIRNLTLSDDGMLFVGSDTGYLIALQSDFSSGVSASVEDGEPYPSNGFRVALLPSDAIFRATFDP